MSTQCRIWWDVSVGAYRMVTPFNLQFKDALLQLVPFSDRAWDEPAGSKAWTISEKYFPATKLLVEKFFRTSPTVITRAQAEAASQPAATANAPIEAVCHEFLKLCSQDAAAKAYRAAAVTLHPDHGGDMTKMSKLNSLWERIKKELYQNGG